MPRYTAVHFVGSVGFQGPASHDGGALDIDGTAMLCILPLTLQQWYQNPERVQNILALAFRLAAVAGHLAGSNCVLRRRNVLPRECTISCCCQWTVAVVYQAVDSVR